MSWEADLPKPKTPTESKLVELIVGRFYARKSKHMLPISKPGFTSISIPLLPSEEHRFEVENKACGNTQLRLFYAPPARLMVCLSAEKQMFSHFTHLSAWDLLTVPLSNMKEEQHAKILARIPTLEEEGELWRDLLGLRQLVITDHQLPMDKPATMLTYPGYTRVIGRNEDLKVWGLHPGEDGDFMLMALALALPAPERGFIVKNTPQGPRLRAYSRLINPVVHLHTAGY